MVAKPSSHYALTKKQLAILDLLYKFRFGTSELIAKNTGTSKRTVNKRLQLMTELEYVGRKYEPSYHLRAQHASFHLLKKGIQTLKAQKDKKYHPAALKNISKDKTTSDQFISHWLNIFGLQCNLKAEYGERLRFFTKTELVRYEYFPQPLPDAYIRLANHSKEKQFFVDLLESHKPFYSAVNRVNQYVEYSDGGEWEDATGTPVPTVILVCDSDKLQRKLLNYISGEIDEDDLSIQAVTFDQAKQLQ